MPLNGEWRQTEVNARWQAEMAEFFVGIDGRPDTSMTLLTEVFHLDEPPGAPERG